MTNYKYNDEKEQLGTNIHKDLHNTLKAYAKITGVPKNMIIHDALIEYFNQRNFKDKENAHHEE